MICHFEYHNTFSRLSFCLVQLHRWHFRLINWLVYRSAAIMASCDKIELFKFVRKTYQDIGIFPPESNPNFNSINLKNGLFSFCLIQFLISTAAYLWFEAESMIEYGIICYTCTTIIFSLAVYLIFLWQSRNILIYIENFERFNFWLTIACVQGFIQWSFIKMQTNKLSVSWNFWSMPALQIPSVYCCRFYSTPLWNITFWIREKSHSSYFFRLGLYLRWNTN